MQVGDDPSVGSAASIGKILRIAKAGLLPQSGGQKKARSADPRPCRYNIAMLKQTTIRQPVSHRGRRIWHLQNLEYPAPILASFTAPDFDPVGQSSRSALVSVTRTASTVSKDGVKIYRSRPIMAVVGGGTITLHQMR